MKLTEAAYTILIQAYAELGASEQSISCLDMMKSEGLKPNIISYAAVITACRDKPDAVLGILDKIKIENVQNNTIALTTAINSLARAGGSYTDIAYKILLDMEKYGPEPNIYTYNNIVRAFAEKGKLDEALSILGIIKEKKLNADLYTFTTLLIACGRSNIDENKENLSEVANSSRVDEIMQQMKDLGVQPDAIAFGAAMDAHRRAGDSLKAVKLLNEMQRQNIEPSAAHYNLVIRTLKSQGYLDKMFKMVMTISLKEGAKINGNTFELVIEALLEASKWKEALLVISAMDKSSYKPSIQVCVLLLEQLEKARQYKAVFSMYRYMVRQGYDFYENNLLNGIFKRIVSATAKGNKYLLTLASIHDLISVLFHFILCI